MGSIKSSELALREEAAQWALRRLSDESDECGVELAAWLGRSPLHMSEYLFAQTIIAGLRRFDQDHSIPLPELQSTRDCDVVVLPTSGSHKEEYSEKRATLGRLITGFLRPLLAVAAVIFLGFVAWRLYVPQDRTYSTELGEQRTIRLGDGSLMELNTNTLVRVGYRRDIRVVTLLRGEAMFTVAHTIARPFRVISSNAVVQDLGTVFSVYRNSGGTRVAVLEGRVQIAPAIRDSRGTHSLRSDATQRALGEGASEQLASAFLATGEEAEITDNGRIVKVANPDVSSSLSWRQRRLVFHDAPLSAVVDEFRRYGPFNMQLDGDTVSQRRISGVFHIDRPETLVEFLEVDKSLQVEHVGNGIVVKPR